MNRSHLHEFSEIFFQDLKGSFNMQLSLPYNCKPQRSRKLKQQNFASKEDHFSFKVLVSFPSFTRVYALIFHTNATKTRVINVRNDAAVKQSNNIYFLLDI